MEKTFNPGDRVEHNDGRIGTVIMSSVVFAHYRVKFDDEPNVTVTVAVTALNFIRGAK